MMEAAAIAQLIMALLPVVRVGANYLIQFLITLRAQGKQAGEWDEATELAYQKSLLEYGPEHLPDAK